MKDKVKLTLIGFILGGLIFGSIGTVFALTYRASDITYSPTDNTWNVTTVGEAINDLALSKTSDNYSTTERVVGSWINGKPLYQKVVTAKSPSSLNTWYDVLTISNVEYLRIVYGELYFNSSAIDKLILNHSSTSTMGIKNNTIKMYITTNDYKSKDVMFIVQYTKTSDTISN